MLFFRFNFFKSKLTSIMTRQPPTAAAKGHKNLVGGQNGESELWRIFKYTADSVLLFKKLINALPDSHDVKTRKIKSKTSIIAKSSANILFDTKNQMIFQMKNMITSKF